jgi:hypothetical protein
LALVEENVGVPSYMTMPSPASSRANAGNAVMLRRNMILVVFWPSTYCSTHAHSQNLRRISRLWIKLEQVSELSRKSLTGLAKIGA